VVAEHWTEADCKDGGIIVRHDGKIEKTNEICIPLFGMKIYKNLQTNKREKKKKNTQIDD